MSKIVARCVSFVKQEAVLSIAAALAILSAFFVPPSAEYLSYIDWHTLTLLFSLMAVVKGFQNGGVFLYLGNALLHRTTTSRQLLLVLVFLPFFFSMLITNDVSLITFVPFGITVLRMAGQERLVIPLVVLQTAAANLGSSMMLTPPMGGNPQNLYLYTQSGMSFGALCLLMLPYVALSGICLAVIAVVCRSDAIPTVSVPATLGSPKYLGCCAAGLVLCLLGIFKLLSPVWIAAIVLVFLLLTDRRILTQVDYSLLGTFIAFFIFIGNVGNIPAFRDLLASLITGHVEGVAVLASQIISNVPAALLLSGFTSDWNALIIGCNLGGLGTLIASMASLISYKQVAREYPALRQKYFLWFTVCNVALLALLLAADFVL